MPVIDLHEANIRVCSHRPDCSCLLVSDQSCRWEKGSRNFIFVRLKLLNKWKVSNKKQVFFFNSFDLDNFPWQPCFVMFREWSMGFGEKNIYRNVFTWHLFNSEKEPNLFRQHLLCPGCDSWLCPNENCGNHIAHKRDRHWKRSVSTKAEQLYTGTTTQIRAFTLTFTERKLGASNIAYYNTAHAVTDTDYMHLSP